MICSSHDKDRRKKYAQQGRGFLLDIVANGRNSVDVDKFDYLKRDARNANVNIAADFGRIMRCELARLRTMHSVCVREAGANNPS